MPELPEVETVRRQLSESVVGRKIVGVKVLFSGRLSPKPAAFAKLTVNRKIVSVGRRAKLLLIGLSGGHTLAVHLKMTGRFRLVPSGTELHRHARVAFRLSGGHDLVFEDMRKFGFIRAYRNDEVPKMLSGRRYGPEPLDRGFSHKVFFGCLSGQPKRKIKAALLDQTCLAGIGNIYADESLWRAGIRPDRPVGSLKDGETGALYRGLLRSLRLSLKHRGTSSEDFLDLYGQPGDNVRRLKAYGRGGLPCSRCGHPISKGKLAGRGTHWCPKCQK